jgi:putative transposase
MTDSKIPDTVLDALLSGVETPEDLLGKEGLLVELQKALMERALGAELTEHVGYSKGDAKGRGTDNSRNGFSSKTVITDSSKIDISVPRDRAGSFEPKLVAKGQTRLPGFDDKVISMYARGMSVREIKGHLEELYGIGVSPDLISRVTDAVVEEVKAWQVRPLDVLYAVVFFDCLQVKVRDEGLVRNKAVYLALGVRLDGRKEILGLWIEQTEGAKFWLRVMNELKTRGIQDVLIAVVDGLKGFPEAINTVFPQTAVQTCIVHLLRYSLSLTSWTDRKKLVPGLKAIYRAATVEEAADRLDEFAAEWGHKYPAIAASWRRNWEHVIPMFAYPPEVRRVLYTTNAIESLNAQVRKVIKNRGHFPNDQAAMKLIYLALRNIEKKWKMPAREWKAALNQFAVLYGDRISQSGIQT